MRSTLYLKFIIMYIIFGFLSLFTVGHADGRTDERPVKENVSSSMYRGGQPGRAADYLPKYLPAR